MFQSVLFLGYCLFITLIFYFRFEEISDRLKKIIK